MTKEDKMPENWNGILLNIVLAPDEYRKLCERARDMDTTPEKLVRAVTLLVIEDLGGKNENVHGA